MAWLTEVAPAEGAKARARDSSEEVLSVKEQWRSSANDLLTTVEDTVDLTPSDKTPDDNLDVMANGGLGNSAIPVPSGNKHHAATLADDLSCEVTQGVPPAGPG